MKAQLNIKNQSNLTPLFFSRRQNSDAALVMQYARTGRMLSVSAVLIPLVALNLRLEHYCSFFSVVVADYCTLLDHYVTQHILHN